MYKKARKAPYIDRNRTTVYRVSTDGREEKLEVDKKISELNARLRWGDGGERAKFVGCRFSEPVRQETAMRWQRVALACRHDLGTTLERGLTRGHYVHIRLSSSDQTPAASSCILPHRSSVAPL
ncbi:hypothetical protein BKA82DRAFT_1008442 [Pisolithus tinctorius]|uniref:Uncharacterized protein n=1 Tax=Pisolithus tinctorius Marx 270 TaxID=870435 RepID=A0A0C3NF05_PISTI|nr:hypothetical protein BKA82DRAFT_1008442 [Pisolithus tinctorius]KIN94315.1 hypothetical protein M404DRAFT_1008442 [Pisolithus tinctorius Marx 270]